MAFGIDIDKIVKEIRVGYLQMAEIIGKEIGEQIREGFREAAEILGRHISDKPNGPTGNEFVDDKGKKYKVWTYEDMKKTWE